MDSPTALELLISKALDGAAAPAEWDALENLAQRDGAAAAELVRGLRAHSGLTTALGLELAGVERVDLPRPRGVGAPWLSGAAGWLAAGLVACLWIASERGESASPPSPDGALAESERAPLEVASAAQAAQTLQDAQAPDTATAPGSQVATAGEAIGELPLLMVESRPLENGGYEVLYMRRTLERARVDELLEVDPEQVVASAANEVY